MLTLFRIAMFIACIISAHMNTLHGAYSAEKIRAELVARGGTYTPPPATAKPTKSSLKTKTVFSPKKAQSAGECRIALELMRSSMESCIHRLDGAINKVKKLIPAESDILTYNERKLLNKCKKIKSYIERLLKESNEEYDMARQGSAVVFDGWKLIRRWKNIDSWWDISNEVARLENQLIVLAISVQNKVAAATESKHTATPSIISRALEEKGVTAPTPSPNNSPTHPPRVLAVHSID